MLVELFILIPLALLGWTAPRRWYHSMQLEVPWFVTSIMVCVPLVTRLDDAPFDGVDIFAIPHPVVLFFVCLYSFFSFIPGSALWFASIPQPVYQWYDNYWEHTYTPGWALGKQLGAQREEMASLRREMQALRSERWTRDRAGPPARGPADPPAPRRASPTRGRDRSRWADWDTD